MSRAGARVSSRSSPGGLVAARPQAPGHCASRRLPPPVIYMMYGTSGKPIAFTVNIEVRLERVEGQPPVSRTRPTSPRAATKATSP